ncbi:MAG: hypothetical protein GWN30_25195, partial [Gammaproteobacteria bacterium]|nr:hypothetical protein [Gammaproteobacteria bacterium]
DEGGDLRLGVILKNYVLHRTGADLDSIGSGWGEEGEDFYPTRRIIESLAKRLKRIY